MRSATMGFAVLAVTCVLFAAVVIAQQAPMPARDTLPDGPRIFDSSRRGPSGRPIPGPQFRVVPMKGLSHPYALAFMSDAQDPASYFGKILRLNDDGSVPSDNPF